MGISGGGHVPLCLPIPMPLGLGDKFMPTVCCVGAYYRPRRYFMIMSRLNRLVLDVERFNKNPGARVVTWYMSRAANQIWYEDGTGTIKSKLNGFCMDVGGNYYTRCLGNPSIK